MSRSFPLTRAVHFLREHAVEFGVHLYRYSGAASIAKEAAAALSASESEVFKTLVFQNQSTPLLVIIDAGHRVSIRKLSLVLGERSRVTECSPRDAERYTGYRVGGISPFATRRAMPVYLDSAALGLPRIYLNGGSHGFMISLSPQDLVRIITPVVADLRID